MTSTNNKKRSNYYVRSINRAINIINLLANKKEEQGITELSLQLNLHKSTVHRLLVTLEDEGFIVQNTITQKYSLGLKFLELGNIVQERIEIKRLAFPVMQSLAQKTQESIDLNILIDDKRVSIEKIDSPHDLRRIIQLGKSLPLYCGGSGKAILAFQSDTEIDRILDKEDLISYGVNTITDKVKLKKHLAEVRKNGYAISFEENYWFSLYRGSYF